MHNKLKTALIFYCIIIAIFLIAIITWLAEKISSLTNLERESKNGMA